MNVKNALSSRQLIPIWVLLITLALAVRLIQIDSPPLEFHVARQYSALTTASAVRWHLFDQSERPHISEYICQNQTIGLEPPLLQTLTAFIWQLTDSEDAWTARSISIIAWLLAAWPLSLLLKPWFGNVGMLAGVSFWLFWPYGILMSRATMPEPLLFLGLFWSAVALRAYQDKRIHWGLCIFALLPAALIKPGFALLILLAWLQFSSLNRPVKWATGSLLVLVSMAYVFWRIPAWVGFRFHPHLLLVPETYKNMFYMHDQVYGLVFPTLALIGWRLSPTAARPWILGNALGFGAFALLNTDATRFADHYQLLIAPAIVMGLASLATRCGSVLTRPVLGLGFVALILIGCREGRLQLMSLEDSITKSLPTTPTTIDEIVARAQAIGDALGDDRHVHCLAPAHGQILAFHGDCIPHPWPNASDRRHLKLRGQSMATATADEWMAQIHKNQPVKWFAITDLRSWKEDDELRQLLKRRGQHVNIGLRNGILYKLKPQ